LAFGQNSSKDIRKARALQLQELSSSIEGVAREPKRTSKSKDGYLRFLGAPPSTHFAVAPAMRGTARQAADAFIKQWRNLFVKENTAVEFSITKINTHKSQSYVRYKQMYAGLAIRSAEVVVQVNAYGGNLNRLGITDNGLLNLYAYDVICHATGGLYDRGWIEGKYISSDLYFNIDFVELGTCSHINTVPEPTTLILFGLVGLFLRNKR